MTKKEAASQVREAKARLGLTWAQLGEAVGRRSAGRPQRCSGSTR